MVYHHNQYNQEIVKYTGARKLFNTEIIIRLKNFMKKINFFGRRSIYPDKSQFLINVNTIINLNFSDSEFDVNKLKNRLNISSLSLYFKLNKITGMSPGEYINFIRIQRASKLLAHEYVSISEISYSVGFRNVSHFSKSFKKHFGLTPEQFSTRKNGNINQ